MYNQLDIFGNEVPKQPVKKTEAKSEQKNLSTPTPPVVIEEKTSPDNQFNLPPDEELDSKLYYPISEVANMFNVNISLLRFWEKEFSILKPRKNKKGDRLFRPEDIRNLKLIYFLLKEGQFSAFHKIASDEMWHFYDGDPLCIYEITNSGILTKHLLGRDIDNGQSFTCVIKAGSWFGSRCEVKDRFSLVGCTVAPGFDFEDFELAKREELSKEFPDYISLIKELTYS